MDIGKVIKVDISGELSKSYLDYAMSVIVARALPDIRDGLKPVHRRILFAMNEMGLTHKTAFKKSASVVGEVLGKYHPHGDASVYDTMVRLAQDFSMRYPLIKGQGNFGSVDGDPAAAMRYTESKMSAIAEHLLSDIDRDTVDFEDNFDATKKEPRFLPALLPNLLLMGSEGIAVGMATKIPPHNLREVAAAVVATIKAGKPVIVGDHAEETESFIKKIDLIAAGSEKEVAGEFNPKTVSFESDITIPALTKHVPGPDFPTGGAIYDGDSLTEVYATGRGRIIVRGIAEIKETNKGKTIIEITELPYQVNKALLVQTIAELVRDKKIIGISTLRDESDKSGMSIVIELKRDARPKSVLNNLFKHTRLQTSFPANFVALVDGTPMTVNLKDMVVEYIKHRQKVIVRRTLFDLTAAKKRAHILEGLKIALDNLDEVIKTIRQSKTQDEAKTNLISRFGFSELQATAILDMQLRRLAALEREKIENEYKEVMQLIDQLIAILKDPNRPLEILTDEVKSLSKDFGDDRRTRIFMHKLGEFSEEELVPKESVLISVTKTGYIKRLPKTTYKSQGRGGKGVMGMTTKEEDEIAFMMTASTHDDILFFTNFGRVFGTKAWEIQEGSRTAKGQSLANLINLDTDEEIRSIIPLDKNAKHLIMATCGGTVKKTELSEFSNLRSSGLIAIKLDKEDKLISVAATSGSDHVVLFTKEGKVIKFSENDVRAMGRATTGVRGINLAKTDEVISMEVLPSKETVSSDGRKKVFRQFLTISENGLGKRSDASEFPLQKRGGQGVKAAIINTKTGPLKAAILVTEKVNQIIVTSKFAQVIKLARKNIPVMGRATQGVIIMRFANKEDSVAAVTALEKEEENIES